MAEEQRSRGKQQPAAAHSGQVAHANGMDDLNCSADNSRIPHLPSKDQSHSCMQELYLMNGVTAVVATSPPPVGMRRRWQVCDLSHPFLTGLERLRSLYTPADGWFGAPERDGRARRSKRPQVMVL